MKGYHPSMKIYHPSSCGVGSALMLELIPFAYGERYSGRLEINIAPQVGEEYEWSQSICVSLDFDDVAQMLMVFRGETESINDGAGIPIGDCTFNMRHVIEPVHGYRMILTKGDRLLIAFMLKPAEALGISLALEQSMAKLVFEMEG